MRNVLSNAILLFALAILAGGLLVISPVVLGEEYLWIIKSKINMKMKIFTLFIFALAFLLVGHLYNLFNPGSFIPLVSAISAQFILGMVLASWAIFRHEDSRESSWLNLASFLEEKSEDQTSCSSLKKSFRRMIHEGVSGEKVAEAIAIIMRLPDKDKLRCFKKLAKKIFAKEAPQQMVEVTRLMLQTKRRLKREQAVRRGQLEEAKRMAILLRDKLSPEELQTIFDHQRRHLPLALEAATSMPEPKRGQNLAKLFDHQLMSGQIREALQVVGAMSTQSEHIFLDRLFEAAIYEGETDLLVDIAERLGRDVSEDELEKAEKMMEVKILILTKRFSPDLNPLFP